MARFGIGARVRDTSGDLATITAKKKGMRCLDYDNSDYARVVWLPKGWLTVADDGETPNSADPFTVEIGKCYLTRDGKKVGPVVPNPTVAWELGQNGERYPFAVDGFSFTAEGRSGADTTIDRHCDLVAEWFKTADASTESEPTADQPSFIVARLTAKGEPRPNARPRVHVSLAAAGAEAQRLADRLGDEFAVYQRVSTKTVDAGPVPKGFRLDRAKRWAGEGRARYAHDIGHSADAFSWADTKQGLDFWLQQWSSGSLTKTARAILKTWIAEFEANAKAAA